MINTKRLQIVPLKEDELSLWVNDIPALEKKLSVSYKATKMEGIFLQIVKGQLEIVRKNPENYLWQSFWLIIRKEDQTVVGALDFKDVPNELGEVEIGYGLGKDFEKNGYMREAVLETTKWALNQKGVKSIIAETENENIPSQNILIKCGFKKTEIKATTWWKL